MTNLSFDFDDTETTVETTIEPFLKKCIKDSKAVESEIEIKPYMRLKPNIKKADANEDDYMNCGLVGKCYKDTWFRLITNQKKIYRFQLKITDYQLRKQIISELPKDSKYKIEQQYYLSFDIEKDTNKLLQFIKDIKAPLMESYNFLCENETVPLAYGCCGLYEKCSNAKRCLQEKINVKYAKGCDYRKNLKVGKVFYGKNN